MAIVIRINYRDVARRFKMKGRQVGGAGDDDLDSKWRFFIDICTKCHFMGGAQGGWASDFEAQAPKPSLWLRPFIFYHNNINVFCFDALILFSLGWLRDLTGNFQLSLIVLSVVSSGMALTLGLEDMWRNIVKSKLNSQRQV